jgi:hypothetical protein
LWALSSFLFLGGQSLRLEKNKITDLWLKQRPRARLCFYLFISQALHFILFFANE